MRDKVWLEEGKKGMPMVGGRSSYKDWERADVRASTAPKDQPTPSISSHPALRGKWRPLIDHSQSERVDWKKISVTALLCLLKPPRSASFQMVTRKRTECNPEIKILGAFDPPVRVMAAPSGALGSFDWHG